MRKSKDTGGYKNRGRFLGWGSGPDADWKVLFSIFLILMLLSVAYSAFSFYRVTSGSFGSEVKDSAEPPIDAILLRKHAEHYEKKKADFENLRNTTEATPDPSI